MKHKRIKLQKKKEEHLNEKDAIVNFRKHLIHEALLTESELVDMEKAVDEAVQKSIEFSENSPYPEDEELLMKWRTKTRKRFTINAKTTKTLTTFLG